MLNERKQASNQIGPLIRQSIRNNHCMMDNKHQNHHLSIKTCYACHKESDTECVATQLAWESQQTSKLIMVTRMACAQCRQQINFVRNYVENNHLSFGQSSQVFSDLFSGTAEATLQPAKELHSVYRKTVEQEVNQGKLYHEGCLPQSIRQLVYYSSFSISQAERREKVKNAIVRVMVEAPVNYANMTDIAILIHYLTCYTSESNAVLILKAIMERVVTEGSPYEEVESEDYGLPSDPLWRKIFENVFISNIIYSVSALLEAFSCFPASLQRISAQKQPIKAYKAASTIKIPKEIEKSCEKCQHSTVNYSLQYAQQKNIMSIIMKSMIREEKTMRKYYQDMQVKNLKEKKEFINKIIKLQDKISLLDRDAEAPRLQSKSEKRSRSISDFGTYERYRIKTSSMIQTVKETSEQSESTTQPFVFKQHENSKQNEPGQSSSSRKRNTIFHSLICQLPEFDPSLFSSDTPEDVIISTVEEAMIQMKEELDKLQKQARAFEFESKRLLQILLKKEQRFIPLLQEKDQLIQRYENALYRMENRIEIVDEVLGPRISRIMRNYKYYIELALINDLQGQPEHDVPHSGKSLERKQLGPGQGQANNLSLERQKQSKVNKKKKKKHKEEQTECRTF